jgi:hypothetical protein
MAANRVGSELRRTHSSGTSPKQKVCREEFAKPFVRHYKKSANATTKSSGRSGTVIEQRKFGTTAGVRIGDGSLYDWAIEEILSGGGEAGDRMSQEKDGGLEMAEQMLAELRKHRVFTRVVETAFDEAERELRRRSRPRRRSRA